MPKKQKTKSPDAFKHWFNAALLKRLAQAISEAYPGLRATSLTGMTRELEPLELKERVRLIRSRIRELLPQDYEKALGILIRAASSPGLDGFDLWPITDFIQTHGVDHPEASLEALHSLTRKFTGEFAIRPFIQARPEKTMRTLELWAIDTDQHVRRLASEGSRPRLPWGERVAWLDRNPEQTLRILDRLFDDSELYVRKSVANHLNDISRSHPELVIRRLVRWKSSSKGKRSENLDWVIRHALRTLIKRGDPGALKMIGCWPDARVQADALTLARSRLKVGDSLEFGFKLASRDKKARKLVVDYVIHHVKANGELAPKVFKLKTFELPAKASVTLSKRHSLKPITTRVYYPGTHRLDIQVNGRVMLSRTWILL